MEYGNIHTLNLLLNYVLQKNNICPVNKTECACQYHVDEHYYILLLCPFSSNANAIWVFANGKKLNKKYAYCRTVPKGGKQR